MKEKNFESCGLRTSVRAPLSYSFFYRIMQRKNLWAGKLKNIIAFSPSDRATMRLAIRRRTEHKKNFIFMRRINDFHIRVKHHFRM